jgi:hypothetical protein
LELISEDGGVPVPAGIKSNRVNVAVGDRQITLSNLDKVLWPQQGFTKGDLIEYYAAVGKWLLPHLKDRLLPKRRSSRYAGLGQDSSGIVQGQAIIYKFHTM